MVSYNWPAFTAAVGAATLGSSLGLWGGGFGVGGVQASAVKDQNGYQRKLDREYEEYQKYKAQQQAMDRRRRLQEANDPACGVCKVFTVNASAAMEVRSFSFETAYDKCIRVKVFHRDGDVDEETSMVGFTPVSDGEVWTLVCDSMVNGTGSLDERTEVRSEDCSMLAISPNAAQTFHLVGECCDEGEVGGASQYSWPVLADYVYDGQDCTAGEFSTRSPTSAPSKRPTAGPTSAPSKRPTAGPTSAPSKKPTASPTSNPTGSPISFNIASNAAAINDAYTAQMGTPLNVPVNGVLLNDQSLTSVTSLVPIATAEGGTVVMLADGSFDYNPPSPTFTGTDTFSYTATGGGLPLTADVTITVLGPPDAVDDTYETPSDTPFNGAVFDNDTDPESDDLTVIDPPVTTDQGGTLVWDPGAGTFTYTPPTTTEGTPSFTGTDTFTYTLSDGNPDTIDDTATVTITVTNQATDAVDDAYNAPYETVITIDSVFDNDVDPEGHDLTVTSNTSPTNGVLTVPDLDAGTYTYTPNDNFSGTDSFTYTVSDGEGGTDTASVVITVAEAGNSPVVADDDSYTANNGITLTAPTVFGNDVDPDGDALTITVLDGVTLDDTTNPYTFTTDNGGQVIMNPATGTFTYDNNGYIGPAPDTFTYTVTDGKGTSSSATVSIDINQAVRAEDDVYLTQLNTPVTGAVHLNDSDPDGDTLTVTSPAPGVESTTTNGGKVLMAADGTFTYTPADGWTGTDTFDYQTKDGLDTDEATVTIIVNAPPDAVDDGHTSVDLLQPVSQNLFDNDSDPDTDDLTVIVGETSDPSCGELKLNADGTFDFYPSGMDNENFAGTKCIDGSDPTFGYTISDGRGGTDRAEVSIATVNDPPKAEIDEYPIQGLGSPVVDNILKNDKDWDEGDLQVMTVDGEDTCNFTDIMTSCTIAGDCGELTISSDGDFTYVPQTACAWMDNFTYTMTDNQGGTSEAVLRFDINLPPGANDDSYQAYTDATMSGVNIMTNDSDADDTEVVDQYGDFIDLKVIQINDATMSSKHTYTEPDGSIFAGAKVSVNKNGDLTFDPSGVADKGAIADQEYTFTYVIADQDGGTDMATVTISMASGTTPPTDSPTAKPTGSPKPTKAPTTDAPATARPTTTQSYYVTSKVKPDEDGDIGGTIDPYEGINADPFYRGDTATFTFKPKTCYVDPSDYDAEAGMAFGHFDADWVDVNPGWPANGFTHDHKHTYDDTCECTWVDYWDSAAWSTTLDVTKGDALASPFQGESVDKNGATYQNVDRKFKIVIINDALNTAGILAINSKLSITDDANLQDTSKYVSVTDYAKIPIADLPIWTLGDDSEDGVNKLTALSMGYHKDAIQRGPFGIVPSSTGSMKSNLPGLYGEWRTGALTVQLVSVHQDDNTDAFELAPWLSNSTGTEHGPVKPPDDPQNYESDETQKAVVFEGTLFWHGGDVAYICGDFDRITGDCYDTGTQKDFKDWYDEMYGLTAASRTDSDGSVSCTAYKFCYSVIDGGWGGTSSSYTIDPITKDHTVEAVFAKIGADCPVFSTIAPTISPAPSVSMLPSADPTTSPAPSVSQEPTPGTASAASFAASVEAIDSRCYRWSWAFNCFKGTYGAKTVKDANDIDTEDTNPEQMDGAKGTWVDTGDAVTCNAYLDPDRAPAPGGGDSCPNGSSGPPDNPTFSDGAGSGAQTHNDFSSGFPDYTLSTASTERSFTYIESDTWGGFKQNLDNEEDTNSESDTFNDEYYPMVNAPSDCVEVTHEYRDTISTAGTCGTLTSLVPKPAYSGALTTPFDDNSSAEGSWPKLCDSDKNDQYIITLKIKDTCAPAGKKCYFSTAAFYLWDIEATDNVGDDMCPIDAERSAITEKNTGNTVATEVSLVGNSDSFLEVISASAYIWCGTPFQNKNDGTEWKTSKTGKLLVDSGGGTSRACVKVS